jgi:O-antigen ligase
MTFIPQIRERILVGLNTNETTHTSLSEGNVDIENLTAGRHGIWRLTLEQFREAPLAGHGRLAIIRTGVVRQAIEELGEPFGHPHSAYIEQLVDNGIPGLITVLLFYLTLMRKALFLLIDKEKPIYIAIGGIALSFILTQLLASLTAQSFYPRQGVVGMWCAIGLMLRIYVEREKVKQSNNHIPFWEKTYLTKN